MLPSLAVLALVAIPFVDRGPALRLARRTVAVTVTLIAVAARTGLTVAAVLSFAPAFAIEGARIYQDNQCGSCHTPNGKGGKLGPPLNGLRARRDAAWVERHFAEPQKMAPGTVMPAYRFGRAAVQSLTRYLLEMP